MTDVYVSLASLGIQGPAGDGTPNVTTAGNLGASYTFALSASTDKWLVGTLNANHALTLSSLVAGARAKLLLSQDGAGNRTLTVNGTSVPVNSTPSAITVVECFYDGTDLYVKGA